MRDRLKEFEIKVEKRTLERNDDDNICIEIKKDYQDCLEIFNLFGDLKDLEKPLTYKILENYNHKVTKTLLNVYRKQTFIFAELNKASR